MDDFIVRWLNISAMPVKEVEGFFFLNQESRVFFFFCEVGKMVYEIREGNHFSKNVKVF
jgi:hypothetical protein